MAFKVSRLAAVLASAAAFSMFASPAFARDRGWGGWGGRHHNRVDAGDVITGILIIGGIAVLADAVSRNKRDRRDDRRDDRTRQSGDYPRDQTNGYGDDNRPEWNQGSGIDAAVRICTNEVTRGSARVDGVDAVNRDGDGWRVQGHTASGGNFTCAVDGSGQIRNVQVDGRSY